MLKDCNDIFDYNEHEHEHELEIIQDDYAYEIITNEKTKRYYKYTCRR